MGSREDVEAFIAQRASTTYGDVLQHFASETYDPAKAHDYYIKTRELKGRDKAAKPPKLSDEQQSNVAYAKEQTAKAQKDAQAALAQKQQEELAKIRDGAQKMREAIAAHLTDLMTQIDQATKDQLGQHAADRAEKLAKVASDMQAKIDALPPIPAGVSKERAAELVAERRQTIVKIRGDAKAEREQVTADSAKRVGELSDGVARLKSSATDSANLSRKQVVEGVQGAVEKARKNFQAMQQAVKAKYERQYLTNYDAIQKNL